MQTSEFTTNLLRMENMSFLSYSHSPFSKMYILCGKLPPLHFWIQLAVRCGNITGPYRRCAFHSISAIITQMSSCYHIPYSANSTGIRKNHRKSQIHNHAAVLLQYRAEINEEKRFDITVLTSFHDSEQ